MNIANAKMRRVREKYGEVLPQGGPLGAWPLISPEIGSPPIRGFRESVLGGNKLALRVFYFNVTKNILLIQNIQ